MLLKGAEREREREREVYYRGNGVLKEEGRGAQGTEKAKRVLRIVERVVERS